VKIRCANVGQQAVFEVDFTNGLKLIEHADGVTVEEIRSKTEAPFTVSEKLAVMQQ
jgi:3-oxoacid CoA-transferase